MLEEESRGAFSKACKLILSPLPESKNKSKTFNSGYSLVVTHLTTNPPVRCLNRAERTGSLAFNILWSNVENVDKPYQYILGFSGAPA
jgi:hypothetical protein